MRKLLATILLVGVLSFMAVPALVGAADIPQTCDATANQTQIEIFWSQVNTQATGVKQKE